MGQSTQFWNLFLDTLREEGLFKSHLGDRFYIENKDIRGNSLVLRLANNKQPYGYFEDIDALCTHMAVEFLRELEQMITLAEERHKTKIEAFDIYVTARELEASFC